MIFNLGESVTWSIGRENNPIILRGLYLEEIDKISSKVLCIEQNGLRRHTELEVITELLKKDDGRSS